MTRKASRNIITKSGQAWKLVLGGIVIAIAALAALVAELQLLPRHVPEELATLLNVFLGFAALVFASLAVRCPACGARWVWIAVSERDHNVWMSWLLALQACPQCNYGDSHASGLKPAALGADSRPRTTPVGESFRTLDRDAVLAVIFAFPAIVVAGCVLTGQTDSTLFWVCFAIVAFCLVAAKQPALLIAGLAFYCIGPLLIAALLTREWESIVGTLVCAPVLAAAWWWLGRSERLERHEFAEGRQCPHCHRPLERRGLHRPVMAGDDQPSEIHWFYRCRCGDQTLFESTGAMAYVTRRVLAYEDAQLSSGHEGSDAHHA